MSGEIRRFFNLHAKVALVTGGGSGLGREFCQVLAEFGADVVCVDRYKERAEETCRIIKKYHHQMLPIQADVSQHDQVKLAFQKVEDNFGRLDVLVNNAGVSTPSVPIEQIDIGEWHRVLNINLNGAFYCMKKALRIMLKQSKGSIINISSVAGLRGVDPVFLSTAPYEVSKAALNGLTMQGAAEYGQYGIRVNCIAPGWHFGTKLALDAGVKRNEEELKKLMHIISTRTPMRRTGKPEELKGLLLYLASDASSFVTGQIIAHDGGWTCV